MQSCHSESRFIGMWESNNCSEIKRLSRCYAPHNENKMIILLKPKLENPVLITDFEIIKKYIFDLFHTWF
jgi:hypothetical protein